MLNDNNKNIKERFDLCETSKNHKVARCGDDDVDDDDDDVDDDDDGDHDVSSSGVVLAIVVSREVVSINLTAINS